MSQTKAFVLLSGGIDSTTCVAIAHAEGYDVEAVSIDYGQRHSREIESAKRVAEYYKIPHSTLSVGDILSKNAMLVNPDKEIPNMSYDDIQGISPTYVPFRNGFMLSCLAAKAQDYVMNNTPEGQDPRDTVVLYIGTHAEDAKNWAYPDCTPEFIGAMSNAIYTGTYYSTRVLAPLLYLTKAHIVRWGGDLKVPYELTWSCYAGGDKHCGTCPTCRARKAAFNAAGIPDPTDYEVVDV